MGSQGSELRLYTWKEWRWAKPGEFSDGDLKEPISLVKFRAKNGKESQGYAAMTGGEVLRLRRVSDIKGLLGKEHLIQWAAGQATEFWLRSLKENTAYSGAQLRAVGTAARKEWKEVRDEAGEFGTLAHEWIEAFLRRGQWPNDQQWELMPFEVANSLALFAQWWDENDFKVVSAEKFLCHAGFGVGGTADLIAIDGEGDLWLLDWKTGKGIYGDMWIQIAAYFGMCLRAGIAVKRAAICRIGKYDGAPQFYEIPYKELVSGWNVFKRLCHSFHDIKEIDKRYKKMTEDHRKFTSARLAAEKADREKQAKFNAKSRADQAVAAQHFPQQDKDKWEPEF